MEEVGEDLARCVLLAGLTEENGARLIKDKVAVLGPNSGSGEAARPRRLRPAVDHRPRRLCLEGHVRQRPRPRAAGTPGPRQDSSSPLSRRRSKGRSNCTRPMPARPPNVVLTALAGTCGSRAAVISGVAHAKVKNGITGTFEILPSGDPASARSRSPAPASPSPRSRWSSRAPPWSPPPARADLRRRGCASRCRSGRAARGARTSTVQLPARPNVVSVAVLVRSSAHAARRSQQSRGRCR